MAFAAMFCLDRQSILFAVIRNFAAIGAIVLALYIIKYLDMQSRWLKIMSRISPEIYFYHMPIALLCDLVLKNTIVYVIVVIVSSLSIAVLINPINRKVQKLLKGV